MTVTIWHNPRCSKSRQALKLLKDRGINPIVVDYLQTPPSADEIKDVLTLLGLEPRGLMRTKESVYKELELANEQSANALITAMVHHPILIERPVVLANGKAAIGRPTDAILEIL